VHSSELAAATPRRRFTPAELEELRQHLAGLIEFMVDRPSDVSVVMISAGLDETDIRVIVAPSDVGKIIGRGGRTARSLRVVLSAIGEAMKCSIRLDIDEPRLNG